MYVVFIHYWPGQAPLRAEKTDEGAALDELNAALYPATMYRSINGELHYIKSNKLTPAPPNHETENQPQ